MDQNVVGRLITEANHLNGQYETPELKHLIYLLFNGMSKDNQRDLLSELAKVAGVNYLG